MNRASPEGTPAVFPRARNSSRSQIRGQKVEWGLPGASGFPWGQSLRWEKEKVLKMVVATAAHTVNTPDALSQRIKTSAVCAFHQNAKTQKNKKPRVCGPHAVTSQLRDFDPHPCQFQGLREELGPGVLPQGGAQAVHCPVHMTDTNVHNACPHTTKGPQEVHAVRLCRPGITLDTG